MPWVDPDEVMIPPCEDIVCDRCGKVEHYRAGLDIKKHWDYVIFYRRHKQTFLRAGETFCKGCAILMTPYVYRLRDIDELTMFVNKLERAIREKRNQNNRSASADAGERGKGRA